MALAADPLLPIKLFFDIGGAGAKADAMAIWVSQWVGPQIRSSIISKGRGNRSNTTQRIALARLGPRRHPSAA
jgi:hypothetical protein